MATRWPRSTCARPRRARSALLLLGGEPIRIGGQVAIYRRRPARTAPRTWQAGAASPKAAPQARRCDFGAAEARICDLLRPKLLADGLYFVSVGHRRRASSSSTPSPPAASTPCARSTASTPGAIIADLERRVRLRAAPTIPTAESLGRLTRGRQTSCQTSDSRAWREREDPAFVAVPASRRRTEEMSIPNRRSLPGPILTLSPEEISRFLMRTRRDQDPERLEVRLDEHLREILERANDFVPSRRAPSCSTIRAPSWRADVGRLTVIACFGPAPARHARARRPGRRRHDLSARPAAQARRHHRRAGRARRVGLRRARAARAAHRSQSPHAGDSTTAARSLRGARPGAAAHLRRVHLVVDPERARRHPRARAGAPRRSDRPVQRPLPPPPPDRGDRARRARRHHLSLLFLDLDDFKRVNDTYGHLAGSRTLREVGQLIGTAMPPGAVAARYGGDEFVIILPGADSPTAQAVAEELRSRSPRPRSSPTPARSAPAPRGCTSRRRSASPPITSTSGRSARSSAARTRCCASPTRRCTAPRRPAENRVQIADPED